jgi:hypothetical protein
MIGIWIEPEMVNQKVSCMKRIRLDPEASKPPDIVPESTALTDKSGFKNLYTDINGLLPGIPG